MDTRVTEVPALQGQLADEITAVIAYVEFSSTRDNSDHPELHKAILEIYQDFPGWLPERIAFLEQSSEELSGKRTSLPETQKMGEGRALPWEAGPVV